MKQYYNKIYFADNDQEALVRTVNAEIRNISPGNLISVDFDAIIERELTHHMYERLSEDNTTRIVGFDKHYIVKHTCIITELVETKE